MVLKLSKLLEIDTLKLKFYVKILRKSIFFSGWVSTERIYWLNKPVGKYKYTKNSTLRTNFHQRISVQRMSNLEKFDRRL